MQSTVKNRTVFCRDNLEILRGIDSCSVDLIYLDPPFNKNKRFTAPIGSTAEGASFSDIFREEDVKAEWIGLIADQHPILAEFLQGIGNIGDKSNKAYLCYMAIRLIEFHRVLKPTGSIYLHCDPTMSHYLKLLLDCVFGAQQFLNEIVWCYTGPSGARNNFPKKYDSILYYCNGDAYTFNADSVRIPYKSLNTDKGKKASIWKDQGKLQDPNVRAQYVKRGKIPENHWSDIASGGHISPKERLGYPTQKPLALLERIVKASSNEGDVVLDPFCGCATTLVAAERLNRRWFGIDISQKAFDLVRERLNREIERPDEMFTDKTYHRTDIPLRTDEAPIAKPATHKHLLYGNQQGICNGCATPFNFRNLEIDHIVPQSKGGGDNFDNLQLLCGHCNRMKGDRDMPYLMTRLRDMAH